MTLLPIAGVAISSSFHYYYKLSAISSIYLHTFFFFAHTCKILVCSLINVCNFNGHNLRPEKRTEI